MKFFSSCNKSNKFILFAACLLISTTAVSALQLSQTFRELDGYKNIAFVAFVGGSSHYNWVLSIGDELGQRGHNVIFLTRATETRHGKPFTHVKTVEVGPGPEYDNLAFMKDMSDTTTSMTSTMVRWIPIMSQTYEQEYLALLSYFRDHQIDVALCDHFTSVCADAAITSKIPYIITEPIDVTSESGAPYINHEVHGMRDHTAEFQSFYDRFMTRFISPWTTLYQFLPYIQDMSARKRALGIEVKNESPDETWKHSLKLINSAFGFVPARPIGPLAEYVGTLIPKQYAPLTPELEKFLNAHQRVAYIAFGQNTIPSEQHINFILSALLESIEGGHIDGFLWAINHAGGLFPDTFTTISGPTYNVQDLLVGIHPHARMVKWAPQTAVLMHTSTALFLSHGGSISWMESMFAGKAMLMFPFFGDQPGNALIIERSGLGDILKQDFSTQEDVALIGKIISDEEIKANVKRWQALVQIQSEHGILRGADLVEEVLYTHKDGKLAHRESADRRMSYIKSHNLDLYAALLSIVFFIFTFIIFVIRWVVGFLCAENKKKKVQKQKQRQEKKLQ